MKLAYQEKDGVLYAKTQGKSVRVNGKVRKVDVLYLGKVIDKENNVFWNRKDGIYVFNTTTGEKLPAPESYTSVVRPDKRVREKVSVDFGNVFFIHSILKDMGYDSVIDVIDYQNRDTLYSMIFYYVLETAANSHAETWYYGTFAKVLYPNANLTSQRISEFLKRLGDGTSRNKYFDAHIEWLLKRNNGKAVVIDSTGIGNSINFHWTALSNHNGKIGREVRLSVPVQRDTGFPIRFHVMQGNIVDVTTLTRDLAGLVNNGMTVDMALFDAGYGSNLNFDSLFEANIPFVTRLSSVFGVYKEIVKKEASSLRSDENLVKYNGRCVYIKKVECQIGKNNNPAYAYLGCDMNRYSDELHNTLVKIAKNKKDTDDLIKMLGTAGLFMLISARDYPTDMILPVYYSRQVVEQFFDVGKGYARLQPLRVHGEDAMFGHLLLSMIAATIFIYIQRKENRIYDSSDDLFMCLRNHKCDIWKNRVNIDSPAAEANALYKDFNITVPIYYKKSEGKSPVPMFKIPTEEDTQPSNTPPSS